jgi:hypothetical protein
MTSHRDRFYRFALYGTTGAGKTCLLGVMALVGTSSRGLSCEYLPVDEPLPAGVPEGDLNASPEEPSHSEQQGNPAPPAQADFPAPVIDLTSSSTSGLVMENPTKVVTAEPHEQERVSPAPEPHTQVARKKGRPRRRKIRGTRREILGLHRGNRWIRGAIEALKSGHVPEANPPVLEEAPLTLDFRIGDPIRGCWLTRLIDYSGELIQPDLQHDPKSFVARLRQYLLQCDGFLVLAEVPRGQEVDERIRDHLVRLREAFASLQEAKDDALRTPVAIIFTKWDRHSQINHDDPDQELRKFREWLERHREYQGLIRSIGHALLPQERQLSSARPQDDGAVGNASVELGQPSLAEGESAAECPGDQPQRFEDDTVISSWGLKIGNAWVFPVSAFGVANYRNGVEAPQKFPEPFGILEPFVWLAERRDRLDVKELCDRWQTWKNWSWLPGVGLFPSNRRLRRLATNLNRRVPRESSLRPTLNRVVRAIRTGALLSTLTTVLTVGILLLTGFSSFRAWQFRYWARVIDDPASGSARLAEARDFLTGWMNLWNGVLVPGKAEAQECLAKVNQKIDDTAWAQVQAKPAGTEEQAKAAEEYLKIFPQGHHAQEARQLVEDYQAKEAQRQNKAWLASLQLDLERAQSIEDLAQLRSRIEKGWPKPEWAMPEDSKALDSFSQKVADRDRDLRQQKNQKWLDDLQAKWVAARTADDLMELQKRVIDGWPEPYHVSPAQKESLRSFSQKLAEGLGLSLAREFLRKIESLANSENWQEAIDQILKYPSKDETWQEAISLVTGEARLKLGEQSREYFKDFRFADVRQKASAASMVFNAFERKVRLYDRSAADQILEVVRLCENLRQEADEREDAHLYGKIQRIRSRTACQDYLKNAPLKVMQRYVESYLNYLEELEKPLNVEVEVRVYWHRHYQPDDTEGGENYISVSLNGNRVVYVGPVAEKPGATTKVGTFSIFQKRRTESVEISVEIWEHDGWFRGWMDHGGSGTQTCSLEELARGVQIPLRVSGAAFENKAELQIVAGWPKEPYLPPWKRSSL